METSDGDWRAIAGADQAGQLVISGETKNCQTSANSATSDIHRENAAHDTHTIPKLVPILRGKSSKKGRRTDE